MTAVENISVSGTVDSGASPAPSTSLVPALHPLKSMNEQELENMVQSAWVEVFGTGATESLLILGEALSEYANRGTSKAKRFDRACDVVRRKSGGLFGDYEQRRIRFAIVAWHLSQRIAILKTLPVSYLTVVIQATKIGVDWKLVTDDSSPAMVERLQAVLPILIDRTLGTIENKSGVAPKLSEWRDVIKRVVVNGEAIQTLIDEQQKTPTVPAPSSPANQPTENQASAIVAENQASLNSVGDTRAQVSPVEPAPLLTREARLAACLQFIDDECDLNELITGLVNHGKAELLTRFNDASLAAFDRLVSSGAIKELN